MRYSAEHKAETHERIVRKAAAEFRSHGLDGVGVADIMKQAGLTHGGFYAHFDSKEALYEEALAAAFSDSASQYLAALEQVPKAQRASALAAMYLTPLHRDRPDRGCALPALGSDVARRSPKLRARFEQGVERLASLIQRDDGEAARGTAYAQIATMVGAMLLARGVRSKTLSDEILASARAQLGAPEMPTR